MSRIGAAAIGLAAGVALFSCKPSGDDQAAFGARVHTYLLAHPEVIQEAADRLQAKQAAADEVAQRRAAAQLPKLRAAVERDPRDFVANPGGKITVTEFFDYRCPHCADAAPAVLGMIRTDPDIRFVFKEMPIFGPTSEHAARAALMVKTAGGNYLGLYQRFMATRPLDDTQIDRLATKMGGRSGETPDSDQQRQLADTAALFDKLDLGGTPAFIVGDTIIPGEDMNAVAAAVARQKGRATGA